MGLSKGHVFATEIAVKVMCKRMKKSNASDDNIEVIITIIIIFDAVKSVEVC